MHSLDRMKGTWKKLETEVANYVTKFVDGHANEHSWQPNEVSVTGWTPKGFRRPMSSRLVPGVVLMRSGQIFKRWGRLVGCLEVSMCVSLKGMRPQGPSAFSILSFSHLPKAAGASGQRLDPPKLSVKINFLLLISSWSHSLVMIQKANRQY